MIKTFEHVVDDGSLDEVRDPLGTRTFISHDDVLT
jgi:hypothetical protein